MNTQTLLSLTIALIAVTADSLWAQATNQTFCLQYDHVSAESFYNDALPLFGPTVTRRNQQNLHFSAAPSTPSYGIASAMTGSGMQANTLSQPLPLPPPASNMQGFPLMYRSDSSRPPGYCDWIFPSDIFGCRIKLSPYGWLSGIHGSTTIRGITSSVNIGSADLFDYLQLVDGAAFGRLEIDNGCCGILLDTYWVALGFDREIASFDFSAQFEMAIVELAFSHQLRGLPEMLRLPPASEIQVFGGGRYWSLEGAGMITTPSGLHSEKFGGKRDWVDPFLGARLTMPVNPFTKLLLRGDIGGFGLGSASEFTWNVEAIVECHLRERCTLAAGYRILDVDNQRGSGNQEFAWDMQFRGPIIQLVFDF